MPGTGAIRPGPAPSTTITASRSELRHELISRRPVVTAGLFPGRRNSTIAFWSEVDAGSREENASAHNFTGATNHSASGAFGFAGGNDLGKILLVHRGAERRHPAGDERLHHQPVTSTSS